LLKPTTTIREKKLRFARLIHTAARKNSKHLKSTVSMRRQKFAKRSASPCVDLAALAQLNPVET